MMIVICVVPEQAVKSHDVNEVSKKFKKGAENTVSR